MRCRVIFPHSPPRTTVAIPPKLLDTDTLQGSPSVTQVFPFLDFRSSMDPPPSSPPHRHSCNPIFPAHPRAQLYRHPRKVFGLTPPYLPLFLTGCVESSFLLYDAGVCLFRRRGLFSCSVFLLASACTGTFPFPIYRPTATLLRLV